MYIVENLSRSGLDRRHGVEGVSLDRARAGVVFLHTTFQIPWSFFFLCF